MTKTRRIVALLPQLNAHGGIQRHNRSFCRVLSNYALCRGAQLDLISLHDDHGWYDAHYLSQPLHGFSGNRAAFSLSVQAALTRPYDLLIVGHVDFLPLIMLPHLLHPQVPIIALVHGVEVWKPFPISKRLLLQLVDWIIAVSIHTAEMLAILQGVRRERTYVIPNTMDADFLCAAEAWKAQQEPPIPTRLLSIARLSRADVDKGIDQVIATLPEVRARVPDVTYTIIGDGNDRPRLEQLAQDQHVADIVRFVGRVPDHQLYAFLSGTDLFLLPSRKEGFGIVFLEAAAFGKPVIGGAHGGSPEVIVDGETGVLVRHGDQSALTKAIVDLLRDEQKRHTMGQANRHRMEQEFSFDRFRMRIERLIDTALDTSCECSTTTKRVIPSAARNPGSCCHAETLHCGCASVQDDMGRAS